MIEIRFSVARAVKARRRALRVTQKTLAQRITVAQATVSRVERASNRVSLDIAVRSLIVLGCTDAEIAAAFNAEENAGIQLLRRRARERCYPKPSAEAASAPAGEHRFIRKKRLPKSLAWASET
ncbi:MAG: helix-turn-helix domain-containing protein [Gemmatimonadota bacterium]